MLLSKVRKAEEQPPAPVAKKRKSARRRELEGTGVAVAAGVLAWLFGRAADGITWSHMIANFFINVATVLWLIASLVLGLVLLHLRWRTSALAVRLQLYRAEGWAQRSTWTAVYSGRAIRKLGHVVRPSLEKRATRDHRPRNTDYGHYLGRCMTGLWGIVGRRMYAGFENCLAVIAPPGKGKTALLLHWIIDAPGAVITASSKSDVYTLTHRLRAQHGPVHLLNPQNVDDVPSTFQWNPLIGCEQYQTATDRASALVHGCKAITAMDEKSWGEKCVEILSKYLMAARLVNYDLSAVARWIDNPRDDEAVRILRHYTDTAHPSGVRVPAGWASRLHAEMQSEAERMRASIWSLMASAVAFMGNPIIAEACKPLPGESFDAAEFVRTRGTVYLIGDDSDETIAPLLAAFTTYLYDGFRAAAAEFPSSRVDPPLGIYLDEVAKITPVPIDKWAADLRAFGGLFVIVVQSFDQIRERYGKDRASAIRSLFSPVLLQGVINNDDLNDISELIGDRPPDLETNRIDPVIKPSEIRTLKRGHALVVLNEARAAIVRFTKGQRRAKRLARRLAVRQALQERRRAWTRPPAPASEVGADEIRERLERLTPRAHDDQAAPEEEPVAIARPNEDEDEGETPMQEAV